MLPQVLDVRSDLPDEILYGRTGYLFALLYLNKCLGQNTVNSKTIQQVRETSEYYLKLTGTHYLLIYARGNYLLATNVSTIKKSIVLSKTLFAVLCQ